MSDFVDFEIDKKGVLKKYRGPGGDVVIPDGVTSVGHDAFARSESLTSVVIPAGATSIGNYSFSGCSSLQSVTIPESVTSIGVAAFLGCAGLQDEQGLVVVRGVLYDCVKKDEVSMAIPDGVTGISFGAFHRCSSLRSVTIPGSVTSIGVSAFGGCKSLTNVTILEGLTSIGGFAFEFCTALEEVCLPNTIKEIGDYAFSGCTSLRRLSVPEGLDSVGALAFNRCNALSQIEVRGGNSQTLTDALLVDPGRGHFAHALFEKDTLLPEDLLAAAVRCLRQNKMTKAEIAQELVDRDDAQGMGKLLSFWKKAPLDFVDTYLTAATDKRKPAVAALLIEYKNKNYPPKKLEAIAQDQADKAMGIKELSISDWRKIYKLSTNGDEATVSGYKGSDAVLEIPGRVGKYRVTAIGDRAFNGCGELVSVTIPEGVLSIGEKAFRCCRKMTNVVIPSGVTSIGYWAFQFCENLTSVTIPKSVTSIGYSAFWNCPNLTIHAPAGSYAEQYAKEHNIPFEAI